jgi:photosystem II stability/assembly factor-like uncharacterized protein
MVRVSLIFLLTMKLTVHAQQWEKLPIYGSAFDQLEVSIFDSTFMVGYDRQGSVFFSTDAGISWQETATDVTAFWSWNYDMVLTENRTAWAMTHSGLWKTTDLGTRWICDSSLGTDRVGTGSLAVSLDGTVIVTSAGARDAEDRIYSSADHGVTWRGLDDGNPHVKVCMDPQNSSTMFWLSNTHAMRSNNGGVSWRSAELPGCPFSSIHLEHDSAGLRLGILLGDECSHPTSFDYYVSRDTGRTWEKRSRQIMDRGSDTWCASRHNNRIVRSTTGVLYANVCFHLYISSDDGITWLDANVRTDDIARTGGMVLGTLPPDGLVRRDESKKSWVPYCTEPKWYGYEYAEYAHARGDTAFVLLSTALSMGGRTSEIRQTTDDGKSWKALLRRSGLNDLQIDAANETRYYLSALPEGGAYAILTGRVDQTEPDTLYSSVSKLFLLASPRFSHHLYVKEYEVPDWWVGYSNDGGATWDWSLFAGVYSQPRLFPSQLHPGTMLAGVSVVHYNFDRYAGLFLKSYKLAHWEKVNDDPLRPDGMDRSDALLSSSTWKQLECSTDYGRTWFDNDNGVEPGYTEFWIFNPAGRVIGTDYLYLYEFHDGSWHKLIATDRMPLRVDSFFNVKDYDLLREYDLDIDDRYVHITLRRRGIYRAGYISDPTGIEQQVQSPRSCELDVYPQPVSGNSATISWNTNISRPAHIRIFDVHGRRIRSFSAAASARSVVWDCRDAAGHRVQPGAYLMEMRLGDTTHRSMIIVQ